MKTTWIHSRAALVALLLLPALAWAPAEGLAQGARVPGMPEARAETDRNKHRRPVEVTFTKWSITNALTGVTGGDVPGDFVGEVIQNHHSVNPLVNPNPKVDPSDPTSEWNTPRRNGIGRIEAIYAVEAKDERKSFTALIRGGQNNVTGVALFEGVIVAGWRTGARVHVVYQRHIPSPTEVGCALAPPGSTAACFEGTIFIEPVAKD